MSCNNFLLIYFFLLSFYFCLSPWKKKNCNEARTDTLLPVASAQEVCLPTHKETASAVGHRNGLVSLCQWIKVSLPHDDLVSEVQVPGTYLCLRTLHKGSSTFYFTMY